MNHHHPLPLKQAQLGIHPLRPDPAVGLPLRLAAHLRVQGGPKRGTQRQIEGVPS
jgi:hypothetical protein